MVEDQGPRFPYLVAWMVLAVVGTFALALIKDPRIKRGVHIGFTVTAGLIFLSSVWTVARMNGTLPFAITAVLVIVALSLWLVRVCGNCAALVYPRFFLPPRFCSKCGAPLGRDRGGASPPR
jgi:hypothetical protein